MANGNILRERLGLLRTKGGIAGFYPKGPAADGPFHVSIIGSPSDEVSELIASESDRLDLEIQEQAYYFLGGELRPGSGIVRSVDGRPEGPSGTLTCFLSSKDGRDLYFAAAGHVVSNYWQSLMGSVYRSRKGFPGTNSSRFLGTIFKVAPAPEDEEILRTAEPTVDIGLVELKGRVDLKSRTTCYGSFGEWADSPKEAAAGDTVMKCGAEETHWTAAVVDQVKQDLWVYGPKKDGPEVAYRLHKQVILRLTDRPKPLRGQENSPPPRALPQNPEGTPFAVAGDSGTMVVDLETKRPVGMLIAGSIVDGLYVMTPFSALQNYWTEKGLVLLRA